MQPRSASSRPTTDLASTMRPDSTHSIASASGSSNDLGVLLLGSVRRPLDRRAVGGEEDRVDRVGHPGARVDRGQQLEVAGAEADLLDQLAPGVVLVGLAVDVAHPGGDLDDHLVVRRPVLRHEDDDGVPSGSASA